MAYFLWRKSAAEINELIEFKKKVFKFIRNNFLNIVLTFIANLSVEGYFLIKIV